MDQLKPYYAQADARLSEYPILVSLEKTTKVPKVYLILSVYILYSISVFFEIGAGVTTNLLGLGYPIYSCLNASVNDDVADLKLWSFYLVVYGIWSTLELTIGFWGSFIPFYYVLKTFAIAYLIFPSYHGISTLFNLTRPQIQSMFKKKQ